MQRLTIGAVANQTGLTTETIRYYEREGLIPPPSRADNGYRNYSADTIQRLKFIKRAKSLGFSLNETTELLAISEDNAATAAEFRHGAKLKRQAIAEKIADLKRMHNALTKLIEACPGEGDKNDCPILNALVNDT